MEVTSGMKCKLFILFGHGRFYKNVFGLTSVLGIYIYIHTREEKEQRKNKQETRQTDRQVRWGLSKEDQTRHTTDKGEGGLHKEERKRYDMGDKLYI